MEIWVLSMCKSHEFGSDVLKAELFKSRELAQKALHKYGQSDSSWHYVDWKLHKETI